MPDTLRTECCVPPFAEQQQRVADLKAGKAEPGDLPGLKDCPRREHSQRFGKGVDSMMPVLLVGTEAGCHVFRDTGERALELAGHKVGPFALEGDGTCLGIVDEREVWRRSDQGMWSRVIRLEIKIQSIVSCQGALFCGGSDEAAMLRIGPDEMPKRLDAFESVSGRAEWFAGGPPLGVRSLAVTADEGVLLAAVHVGGIPRSDDGGASWEPSLPVMFDVHEVRAHPVMAELVVAAAAVGLCVSKDRGMTWEVFAEGLGGASCLAVAALENEVLFSVQDGPFARRSQLWRWRVGSRAIEAVRDGLPEWMEGKVDTHQMAAGCRRFAVVDGGGNLWVSEAGSYGWKRFATGLPYALGVELFCSPG